MNKPSIYKNNKLDEYILDAEITANNKIIYSITHRFYFRRILF